MKNKIGWCDMTFNPVWGCRNHCEYCYARGIAKRFADVIADKEHTYYIYKQLPVGIRKDKVANRLRHFKPTFLESHFDKKFPKKPQWIFVGSMSEIYYWEEEWIERVIEKVKEYPQHIFQFLTKHPEVYIDWTWPKNCILGVTITREEDFNNHDDAWYYFFNENNKTFFSFEPLLGLVEKEYLEYSNIDWVIVGAETGNRKGKIIPKREWIDKIVHYCRDRDIPVYLKDNLKNIHPVEIKEFPKKEIINE